MFITKKHLPRRTFLRGLGVTMALPLLDAMIPARTALAQTAAAPSLRAGFIYFPHGAVMSQWTPEKTGTDFEFTPILKPLEAFRKQMTIISGLENKAAIAPPVHALSPGTWLSGVAPRKSQDPWGGKTIDQMIAEKISRDTPFPSLEVGIEARGGGGSCDREYGCSYAGTISFRTPNTPLPVETDPRKLFQRMFGQGDSPEERKRISQQYSSVLDLVSQEAADLQKTLGASDRVVLTDYLDTVREIEHRVEKMEARDLSKLKLPPTPNGPPTDKDAHLNLMIDLITLAYQGNLTRVFSLMMAGEVSGLTYPVVGVSDAYHPISHYGADKSKQDKCQKIQTYYSSVMAKFLTKLQALPDGDGTMLDHTMIVWGSNMSNSDRHNHFPLPMTILGGSNGKVKGGQHLRYPDQTPLSNLLLTVVQRAGLEVDKVGDDGTKPFSEV
ncbi:MAG TPA: DUF1552 domain-containing protein [Terriglobia bacterium]|nr:DUF1552 domain-containing protein [Terriglobia bacterium]